MTSATDEHYEHLGPFSDWVREARSRATLHLVARPGPETRRAIRDVLGFAGGPGIPEDVRVERRWTRDGLRGEEVSWSTGYGPRTSAWLLIPADSPLPLPGVVALHGHDGFKFFGKEKIADGPQPPPAAVAAVRGNLYGGRAFASDLARRGSNGTAERSTRWSGTTWRPATTSTWWPSTVRLLGTTLAGVVAYEDRVAVAYLLSRPEVSGPGVGCVGLSGGGCRAALAQATSDQVAAAVVVGMMSTQEALLDRNIHNHTWMFLPPGLALHADWPDLAACRAPSPLNGPVQLGRSALLTSRDEAAHDRIAAHYEAAGGPDAYVMAPGAVGAPGWRGLRGVTAGALLDWWERPGWARFAEASNSSRTGPRRGPHSGVREEMEVCSMQNGTIKKIVSDRGFGFIAASDGTEYFFHRDGVDNFDSLRGGESVTFNVEASPKGPRANQVKLSQ